jgi:hypothetical protein
VRWLLLLAACSSKAAEREPEPAPPALRSLGAYADATLVASGTRVAVVTGDHWYELGPGAPANVPAIATEIAKLRDELGDVEVYLGAMPIVVGGEEHHEQYIRLAPERSAIDLDGHLVRVAATGGHELWQFEERLRAQLATVGERGLVVLPAHANAGPPIDSPSPVSAKRCAAPAIADLAVAGDAIHALLVECNPAAPVRIATHRWPGPRVDLASFTLALAPQQLAGATIAGVANGTLALATNGTLKPTTIAASVVIEAVAAADGAIWTLTTTEQDQRTVARDGVAITVARPAQLAFDTDHGVVVLASDGTLLAER